MERLALDEEVAGSLEFNYVLGNPKRRKGNVTIFLPPLIDTNSMKKNFLSKVNHATLRAAKRGGSLGRLFCLCSIDLSSYRLPGCNVI